MNIFNIVIIVILILIVIFVFSLLFTDSSIIYDDILTISNKSTKTSHIIEYNSNKSKLTNTTSNFTISVWFYINEWNQSTNHRNILYMNNIDQSHNVPTSLDTVGQATINTSTDYRNFNILLDKYRNDILVDIITTNESDNTKETITRYHVNNVPIQKWNCLTISIDTKTMDIYLGGKLVKSYILPGIYKSNNEDNIYLGNSNETNFNGYITRVRYLTYFINPQESYEIYMKGIKDSISKNLFNKYALKLAFMEDNKEKSSVII